jgi:photosystem II stability/assembly factor-like uncharacterized protein
MKEEGRSMHSRNPRTCLTVLLLLSIPAAAPAPLTAAFGRWSPLGPEGGEVLAIVFAPSDPRVVYTALGGGGVFRSTDGGVTWTAPSGPMAGQFVTALAVDPVNPAIVYAGTSDGIWKSATGGAAWTVFPNHLAGIPVLQLAVDPARRQTVYAGTPRGIFRSDNGGRRWAPASQGLPAANPAIGEGQVAALTVDPGPPVRLFTAIQRQNGLTELFASTDRGVTWTQVSSPEPAGSRQVSGFVWDRTSHTLYLNAWPAGLDSGPPSLWKTSDGGASWSRLVLPDRLAGNDVRLAVDAAGTLYAGSLGVWRSADAGAHWSEVGPIGAGGGVRVFAFAIALAADPGRAGRLLAGAPDLGIFESTGGAWRAVNGGLTATIALGLEIVPAGRRNVLYAAVSSGGVLASRDGGAHWTPLNQGLEAEGAYYPFIPVSSLALDPRRSSRLYTGVIGGVALSQDSGEHWSFRAIDECTTAAVLAVDPGAGTIYAGMGSATYEPCDLSCLAYLSRDAGETWACMPGVFEAKVAAVDPVNTAVVYVAGDVQRGIFKSTDRGASFVPIGGVIADQEVRALAISPAAHRVVYAGTIQGLFKSGDAGAHWSPTGLSSGTVSALAGDARLVYAAVLGRGVFRSVNGGASWTPLNDGLPAAAVSGPLRLDPRRSRTLYAGTRGSGFWSITLP